MPKHPTPSSAPSPPGSDPLIDELQRRGWPLTKAAYLHLMYAGEPTFPLDAEVASAVPSQLAGPLPSNSKEYWLAWIHAELARQAGLARQTGLARQAELVRQEAEWTRQAELACQAQECRACGQVLTEDALRLSFGWLCLDCLELL